MAYCNQCQSYIKNIPYDKPKLYVGKYKGIPIDEIEDFRYLKWALENLKNSVSIRIALIDRIEFLELSKDPTNNG